MKMNKEREKTQKTGNLPVFDTGPNCEANEQQKKGVAYRHIVPVVQPNLCGIMLPSFAVPSPFAPTEKGCQGRLGCVGKGCRGETRAQCKVKLQCRIGRLLAARHWDTILCTDTQKSDRSIGRVQRTETPDGAIAKTRKKR